MCLRPFHLLNLNINIMRRIIISLLVLTPCLLFAQFGVKAGLNFANITNANQINASSHTGFNVGIFLDGSSKSILSSHSELLFSRQGYDFANNVNTGTVNLNYLILPQFLAINITKYVQIQAGGYLAYLLSASVDSTASTGNPGADNLLKLYNRMDYSFAGGVEIHPIYNLIVGARLNVSLGKLYKQPEEGQTYSFIPDFDAKNNVLQIYAGYKFGKEQ